MADIVPTAEQRVIVPAEIVREQVRSVIAKQPDLISFDVSDEKNESLALRCAVDPGIAAGRRDGWTATVTNWHLSCQEIADEKTGEVSMLPSLALVSDSDELCRLYGWPAVKSWSRLITAAGVERCALGIRIRVSRRASGTAGRSYWIVLPA